MAFYGDSHLQNRLLGVGCFDGFIPVGSLTAVELLQKHELYSKGGVPVGLKGFVSVRHFSQCEENRKVDVLEGTFRSGSYEGQQIREELLPTGPSRAAVYFLSPGRVWEKHSS